MIKRVLHKTASVFLAFLVLFSTLSFTVEKHYCGGELIDVAIFSDVKKCDSERPSPTGDTFNKPCCKDEVKLVKGQDKLKLDTTDTIDFKQVFVADNPQGHDETLYQNLPKRTIRFKNYRPPNLVYDIHILVQVFLN